MQNTVLTIAGSDSSGGAGIQADLKTIAANGGYGASVITALTAQNTRGVHHVQPVSLAMIDAQMDAVFDDLSVVAVKTGMLMQADIVHTVATALARRRPRHIVCDPVMVTKRGAVLLEPAARTALLEHLLPLVTVFMPNVHEAAELTGFPIRTVEDAERAGHDLVARGAAAVLVKGGHLTSQPATDVLVTAARVQIFHGTFVEAPHTHGTGCTFAAALATQLAHGLPLVEAVGVAKLFVTEAIAHGLSVGHGVGPTNPFFFFAEPHGGSWLSRLGEMARRHP